MKTVSNALTSFMDSPDEEVLIIRKIPGNRYNAEIKTLSRIRKDDSGKKSRKIQRVFHANLIKNLVEYLPIRSFTPRSSGKGIKRNQRLTTKQNQEAVRDSVRMMEELGIVDDRVTYNPYKENLDGEESS